MLSSCLSLLASFATVIILSAKSQRSIVLGTECVECSSFSIHSVLAKSSRVTFCEICSYLHDITSLTLYAVTFSFWCLAESCNLLSMIFPFCPKNPSTFGNTFAFRWMWNVCARLTFAICKPAATSPKVHRAVCQSLK